MFKSKTVFIVGAGASAEFGLPIGSGLKKIIAKHIDISFEHGYRLERGNSEIVEAINEKVRNESGNPNQYYQAGRRVGLAMPVAPSIDNYLDAHKHDKFSTVIGKLGIVASILEAERNSSLYFNQIANNKTDLLKSGDTWLSRLSSFLVERIDKNSVDSIFDNVAFIVFNYDRCVELYLHQMLQDYYGINEKHAANLIKGLTIIHPYGHVGCLPWQSDSNEGVYFGSDLNGRQLLVASERIRTFTERIEDSNGLIEINKSISSAARMVFLGFSFQPQNMELLSLEKKGNVCSVFATAYNMSDHDCNVVKADIQKMLKGTILDFNIEIRNTLKCQKLFDEYTRTLTS